jgi:hypothetical protein
VIKLRQGSVRRSRGYIAGVAALAAGCVGALALPGGASAAFVNCGAHMNRTDQVPGVARAMDYTFGCSEAVQAYSITSNRQLDYFSPEADAFIGTEPTGESFACEGPLPGPGFGCHGSVAAWHHTIGQLAPVRRPCAVTNQSRIWKVWLTVTVSEYDGVHPDPYTTNSEPFRVKTPCTTTHRHRHRG